MFPDEEMRELCVCVYKVCFECLLSSVLRVGGQKRERSRERKGKKRKREKERQGSRIEECDFTFRMKIPGGRRFEKPSE